MKRINLWLLLLPVSLAIGWLVGCRTPAGGRTAVLPLDTPAPVPTLDPRLVALGQQVYDIHCASCHGIDLEGEPDWQEQNPDGTFRAPPHDARGHTWHHSDDDLLAAIRLGGTRFDGVNIGGTSPMPAFEAILTAAEMQAVLSFIKSSWPPDIRASQASR